MDDRHDRVLDYFLLPNMKWFRRTYFKDSFLRTAVRLRKVTNFYAEVKKLWAETSNGAG
jgi:hypothetical protein